MVANTLQQCLQALPACAQLEASRQGELASRERSLALANLWNHLSTCESRLEQYALAEQHGRQALALWQKLLGAEDPNVAVSLHNLAIVLDHQGKHAEAERLHRQALALLQELLGTEHITVTHSLYNLAIVLDHQGKYAEAERLHRQALVMRHKLLGAEHPDVAASLNCLANVLDSQGKYAEAERLHRQALALRQELLGAEHLDVAESLDNLGTVLGRQGQYAEAERRHHQALALRLKLWGAEHLDVANSLNNLAILFDHQGKYAEAERLYRQALALRQKLLGPEHPDVAASLANLGNVLSNQGRYAEGEGLNRQALALRQKLLGAEHPNVVISLNNLGTLLNRQGKYAQAEGFNRQALALGQKLLGTEHPDIAVSLDNLANVLDNQGKYAEAEGLHRQALALRQKLLGAEHPDVAASLNNLANVLDRQGKAAEAGGLHRQTLALLQKLLGTEHPNVADALDNSARWLDSQGKFVEAERLYRQALEMRQKLLGSVHPDVAASINNLGNALERQGKFTEAERLYRQALALRQKLLGAAHPDVAHLLGNLSASLIARGEWNAAIRLGEEAARIREGQFRATVSETRTQALLQSLRNEEDRFYSLLLSDRAQPAAQRLALSLALLRKGRAAEAGTQANRLLHRKFVDIEVQKRFDEWKTVRQQREKLLYGGPGALAAVAYQALLNNLQLQAESLEAQLAQSLPAIRSLQPPAFDEIVPAVAKRLPQSGILVEVVWTRPFFQQLNAQACRWGTPHYVALFLTADQRIESVDLGPAIEVDDLGRDLASALRNPNSDPKPAAQALFRKLFAPLLPHLSGKKELFLSLDGSLHLLPFDALHDGSDYLLGKYHFHYMTSGRDLLRQPSQRSPGPALVLGNPDFGQVEPTVPGQTPSLHQLLNHLPPLPAAQREAEQVATWLGVNPLLGAAARKEAVGDAHAPWILHLATHGLFLGDVELPAAEDSRSSLRPLVPPQSKSSATPEPPGPGCLPGDNGAMNRSTLVLAGVRQGYRAGSFKDDGLLTAENSRSLDLDGTQLVTLSACETGQGMISIGQGVYGLRRAFLVAGAETLVTSLWRVDDKATGELMTLYYRKLLDTRKPGDRLGAMVEAMQELRARPGRAHPYYWAPFLVIGQEGPLRRPPTAIPQAR